MPLWKKPVLNRWWEVHVLYPLFSSAAIVLAFGAAIGGWEGWTHRPRGLAALWLGPAGWVAACYGVRWCIVWFRPTKWHATNGAKYPSGLRAATVGYSLFLTTWPWADVPTDKLATSAAWAILPLVVFWSWRWYLVAKPAAMPKQSVTAVSPPTHIEDRPLAEILRWAKENEPIETAQRDLFAMGEKATVVAQVLETPRGDGQGEFRQAVAIRGNFGVGKTSLINLVREILEREHPGHFLFVDANCWGFESSAKAKEHVLELCVDTLNDHVDCNRLRRIPSHYGEAVGGASGWAKPAAAFALAASPAAELKAFGPILKAIDASLVVAIEDADRNGKDFDTGQILALLHHLRGVPRISFIVSASRDSSVELFKVVERTVFIDPAEPQFVLKIINKLRDVARQKAGYIDPETLRRGDRANGRAFDLTDPQAFRGQHLPTTVNWALDLAALLGSIRVLKGVLRDFDSAWQRHLWGEVDPDQLLIVCALRHGAPQIFDFLRRYWPDIDALPDTASDGQNGPAATTMAERWKQECAPIGHEARSAATLVAQLFPKLAPLIDARRPNRRMPLQSVAGANGGRYWRRIISGVALKEEPSDRALCKVLVDLQRGTASAAETLAQMIVKDPQLAAEVVRADGELDCLEQSDRLAVISHLLTHWRAQPIANTEWNDAPWSKIREWIPTTGGVMPDLRDWFEQEISAALPDHPQVAADLIVDMEAFLTPPAEMQRGQLMLRVLRRKWQPLPPAQLARTFAHDRADLRTLLRPILQELVPARPLPTEECWLPRLLLASLRAQPVVMLPPMLFAFKLSDSLRSRTSGDFFDRGAIARFFGDDTALFFRAIAEAGAAAPGVIASTPLLATAVNEARQSGSESS